MHDLIKRASDSPQNAVLFIIIGRKRLDIGQLLLYRRDKVVHGLKMTFMEFK